MAIETLTYRNVTYNVYNTLPHGWIILKRATTAPKGYKWIRSTKSIFDKNKKLVFLKEEWK